MKTIVLALSLLTILSTTPSSSFALSSRFEKHVENIKKALPNVSNRDIEFHGQVVGSRSPCSIKISSPEKSITLSLLAEGKKPTQFSINDKVSYLGYKMTRNGESTKIEYDSTYADELQISKSSLVITEIGKNRIIEIQKKGAETFRCAVHI